MRGASFLVAANIWSEMHSVGNAQHSGKSLSIGFQNGSFETIDLEYRFL